MLILRREIMDKLVDWKNDINKKALIITGAKGVGKTFIIREFAKNNYDNYVELNLINSPRARAIFSKDLSVNSIINEMSLLTSNREIKPGKTLLFLDDIQGAPDAITALKTLSEKGGFDIIACGRSINLAIEKARLYPVGYVEKIALYPLGFIEFLWAKNVEQGIIDNIENCFKNKIRVPDIVHEKMNELFMEYVVVGGMPSAVVKYIQSNMIYDAMKEHEFIINEYKADVAKYASKSIQLRVKTCFDSIPNQLAKDNKKYHYSLLRSGGKAQYFASSIDWIVDSGVADKLYRLTAIDRPLKAYADPSAFKLYLNDTGLFTINVWRSIIFI